MRSGTVDHTTPKPELYGLPGTCDSYRGMPYRRLGNSGLRASSVGLGTWKFGYPETGDGSRVDGPTALRILDRAAELGVTFWDTASRYNRSSGNSERIIGKWLSSNPGMRRSIVLATKVFGCMDGRTPNHCGLSRANLIDSVYACLSRLNTDHIDLLYFHSFDRGAPLEESLAAVEDLVRLDMVRYFGVSNVTVERLRQHRDLQAQFGVRTRVTAVQNAYNVLQREFRPEQIGVLEYCAESSISYVPYSPLARGLLTERYLDRGSVGPGDRLVDEGRLESYASGTALAKVRRLDRLAKEWGLHVSQVALAYTLTVPGIGPVIPGVTSIAQLESNAAAGLVTLADGQIRRIASALQTEARAGEGA